jgi:hypothetical protein
MDKHQNNNLRNLIILHFLWIVQLENGSVSLKKTAEFKQTPPKLKKIVLTL